jgi:hypothetical protein
MAILVNTMHASHAHGVPMIVQTPPRGLDSEIKTMPVAIVLQTLLIPFPSVVKLLLSVMITLPSVVIPLPCVVIALALLAMT